MTNELYVEQDERVDGLPSNYWAIDTETTQLDPGTELGKTRVSPFRPGRLVVGSFAGQGWKLVFHRDETVRQVRWILESNQHLVFHNASYDVNVLVAADPTLKPLFVKAYIENRIHDTKILEVLVRVARGVEQHLLHKNTHLVDLAKRYAGISLDKNNSVRMEFEQFESGEKPIPQNFLEYSAMDAVATYCVYNALRRRANILASREHRGTINAGALERFGPLCERNHVMGDVAINWLATFPIRVDTAKIRTADAAIGAEVERLAEKLKTYSTIMPVLRKRKAGDVLEDTEVPWAKQTKRGCLLSHKALRFVLHGYAIARDIIPPRTADGSVSLERDFWAEVIPRCSPKIEAAAEDEKNVEARLSVWMAYTRVRMMRTRYLDPLLLSERHFPHYKSLGARTTRTSANRIPIQQIPKHRDSLRGAFIPEPGRVFIEADYCAAELTALAQMYSNVFGGSILGDAINAGKDPHVATARRLFDDFDQLPADRQKELRQACKAVNFGLPGGMGARTFADFARGFGVYLTFEEAKQLRHRAMSADPQLSAWVGSTAQYQVRLAARNLCMTTDRLCQFLNTYRAQKGPNWNLTLSRLRKWVRGKGDYEIPVPPGFHREIDTWKEISIEPTGTMRGGCFFTDSHNFPFQGGIASVGKLALFHLWSAWTPEDVWAPAAFVHDSIMVQTLDDPDQVQFASELLESTMIRAIRECCPDVRGGVDVEKPKKAWGALKGVFAE